MSLLKRITPSNLLEEKEKFLADNSYNPQFIYEEPTDQKILSKYSIPKKAYLSLATQILVEAYFNRNEADLFMMEGNLLGQDNVTKRIQTFLEMHGLEKRFDVVWSSSFIVRTTITKDTIKLRLPVDFRQEGLLGMLYHEVGTHALRRINYEKQPWYKKKKAYGFSDYLKTEEGLASLHSLLPHSFKLAFIPAIRYLAVHWAQEGSFVEVWQKLGKYIQDPERRWMVTLRQKRGITDTSKPGGFTKDLVYFEGLVDVWRYLAKNNFDITELYFGKLAMKDASKAREMNPNFQPSLPSFFVIDRDDYAQEINKIGQANKFDEFKND